MGGDGQGSFSSRFIQRLGTVTASPKPEVVLSPDGTQVPSPAHGSLLPLCQANPRWKLWALIAGLRRTSENGFFLREESSKDVQTTH